MVASRCMPSASQFNRRSDVSGCLLPSSRGHAMQGALYFGLPGQRVHEAIEMVESSDVPDNHVLEELQPGYKMKDRLLRPAMVRVAKNHKSVN